MSNKSVFRYVAFVDTDETSKILDDGMVLAPNGDVARQIVFSRLPNEWKTEDNISDVTIKLSLF